MASGAAPAASEVERLEQRIADLERTLKSATPKR
jgi:hypothetical protein